MHHVTSPFVGFVWVLVLASLTTAAAQRLRMPYTVALVLVGAIVSALGLLHEVRISGDAILVVFLPPLLFEAAMDFDPRALGRALPEILTLAVPGVLVSAAAIGVVLWRLTPLGLWPAVLFGAIIAATDPVSVVAAFRRLGAPAHLVAVIEGESVLNDGTAVALAASLLVAAETGHLDVWPAIGQFVYSVVAALGIGGMAGLALSLMVRALDDELIETTLSTVLAYGSYVLADQLNASGIIAAASAGLVFGTLGRRFGMSEEARHVLDGFWHYVGFLANAILFILIGLEIRIHVLLDHLGWTIVAVAAVVAVRALMVYTLTAFMRRVSFTDGHVLVWGGLRGGVALAVALSLPATLPGRSLILALTFGVVLFTTLVQGLTIGPLARRLGVVAPPERGREVPGAAST